MPLTASDLCKIVLAIFLPPLGVFLERGCNADFFINILLTILGYIPVSHANCAPNNELVTNNRRESFTRCTSSSSFNSHDHGALTLSPRRITHDTTIPNLFFYNNAADTFKVVGSSSMMAALQRRLPWFPTTICWYMCDRLSTSYGSRSVPWACLKVL